MVYTRMSKKLWKYYKYYICSEHSDDSAIPTLVPVVVDVIHKFEQVDAVLLNCQLDIKTTNFKVGPDSYKRDSQQCVKSKEHPKK